MSSLARPFPIAVPSHQPSPLEEEVTALFEELRSPVMRYLCTFGLAAQDGEEVIQEVFLSLFQHLRDGKPRTNLRGWVFRVAHNLGLKRCLKNRQGIAVEITSEEADSAPSPEELVSSKQRSQRLLAVVRALPEQDRRCLYLRAEGLRYREITEVLGVSLGTVAQSLERSLERLASADKR